MRTEPELLNERLDRLALILDEIMPNCANLVRDALDLLKEQEKEIENLKQTAQSMMEGVCLLKEQEAVKPVLDEQTGRIWLCGKCGTYVGFEDNDPHDPNEFDKYCRECGRPVLWEGRVK